jgi:hypothetical protein
MRLDEYASYPFCRHGTGKYTVLKEKAQQSAVWISLVYLLYDGSFSLVHFAPYISSGEKAISLERIHRPKKMSFRYWDAH